VLVRRAAPPATSMTPREAEIEDPHPIGARRTLDQEHVVRLEVAVHDAGGVGECQRVEQGRGDLGRALHRQPAAVHRPAQRLPREQRHHQIGGPVLGATLAQRVHHPRVIDARARRGLAEEPRHHDLVVAELPPEQLDRQSALAREGGRLVDHPDPARADQTHQAQSLLEDGARER
jgi:hypothetical protein